MSNITLKQLEYLIAAAEAGSVTAAAARVYLSQSAVSTALTDLEASLGVQVFIRHPRGLALTNAGERVLADARRLVAGMADLRNSASESDDALSGSLIVGCYSTLAPILLPRIIADFMALHPGVDLTFTDGSQTQMETKLRDGSLDLALMYDYQMDHARLPKDLVANMIVSTPPYVMLPEGHELAAKESVSLQELAPAPMILFDLAPGGDYFLSLFSRQGVVPNIRYRTSSFEMVRSLVARGLGYSILNQRTNINVSYEGLGFITRPIVGSTGGLNVAAVHLSNVRLTRRTAAFIDQCRASLRPAS